MALSLMDRAPTIVKDGKAVKKGGESEERGFFLDSLGRVVYVYERYENRTLKKGPP
jgi:hypothetical protein